MAIYDKNMFLQGVAVGLALGRKAYDYFWKKSSTTPVTDNIFLERQKIAEYNNITSHDICSRHKNFGVSPDKFYVAFVSQGKAYVASTTPKKKLSWQVWEEEQFVRNATDVAIEFDGKFVKNGGKEEFITNDEPHIFWVTPEGSLKCSILGLLGETLLASENCTKVTAIRAICDNYSFDYGLVVFFIDAGKIYYRQLISGNWTDAEQVNFGGTQYWIDISAFRTQDYRIVLQAKNINGEVYELYSQFMGIGKHGTEHLQIDNITVTSVLTAILYKDFKSSDEHLNITSAMWGALYGGLYDVRTPSIVNAYNIEDQNEDWGTIAIFVFDKHLVAAEVAAQYTAFSIVDSRNVTFTATSATLGSDGKTVTLTFLDYNNANGVCAAKYTPGTVTSMAGTTLVATSFNWTPQNLVPSLIPAPEVYSIVNVGITDIGYNRVRFYDTTGETLLYTEYVHDGDDCEYGTNEVWAITANSGTIAVDITENVENSMDLYLARWRVRYYSKDGQTLSYTEYVVDGEDAEWGAGRDWSASAGGQPVSGILTDIHENTDVYSMQATLLVASVGSDILAEALSTDYVAGQTNLGRITIYGTPIVQSDGALRMPGSTAYAGYPDNAGQAMTIYGVISGYGSDIEWGRAMTLAYANNTRNEIALAYRSGNRVWYGFYNVTNINTGLASNVKHVFALAVDSSKNVKSYIDGTYLRSDTLNNVGYARWTYGVNADYQNADFYYGAVVRGQESDATIIANMQNLMQYYGVS